MTNKDYLLIDKGIKDSIKLFKEKVEDVPIIIEAKKPYLFYIIKDIGNSIIIASSFKNKTSKKEMDIMISMIMNKYNAKYYVRNVAAVNEKLPKKFNNFILNKIVIKDIFK